jgi:hypothetical protein
VNWTISLFLKGNLVSAMKIHICKALRDIHILGIECEYVLGDRRASVSLSLCLVRMFNLLFLAPDYSFLLQNSLFIHLYTESLVLFLIHELEIFLKIYLKIFLKIFLVAWNLKCLDPHFSWKVFEVLNYLLIAVFCIHQANFFCLILLPLKIYI